MTLFDDVGAFHRKFGLPHHGDGRPPRLLSDDEFGSRYDLIIEEFTEFTEAHERGDVKGCLDALVDLSYVVLGTAHSMGLPFDEGHEIVHAANMTKVRPPDSPDHAKIAKPEGWKAPDHGPAIERAILRAWKRYQGGGSL